MNKLTLVLVLFAFYFSLSTVWAQAPQSFEYQAVVRDASGNILVSQAVSIQITLKQGSTTGTNVYQETFSTTTNLYGLVNLQIGTGTTGDDFTTINWANGPYFIEVALDATGGTSYSVMGTSQLLSVPYALHAKTVEIDNVDDADSDSTNELQVLTISHDTISLTDGGDIALPVPNNLILTDDNGKKWDVLINSCGEIYTSLLETSIIEIVEVMYDPIGFGDDQHEWIKIHNPNCYSVDLSLYKIATGGLSFIERIQLSGVINAGDCMIIGGPISDSTNGNPIFDIPIDFPYAGIENAGTIADGVAIYYGEINTSSKPIDVVIYGESNDNNLPGTNGLPSVVHVGDAPAGFSIIKSNNIWQINPIGSSPTSCP